MGRRPPSFLGARNRHKKTFSRESYAFPNEYSIPTIPLPPQDTTTQDTTPGKDNNIDAGVGLQRDDVRMEDHGMLKPQSPARFRRRTTSAEDTALNKTNEENKHYGGREISVRFEIPESPPAGDGGGDETSDLFLSPEKLDIQPYPMTSTPNPSKLHQHHQHHRQRHPGAVEGREDPRESRLRVE